MFYYLIDPKQIKPSTGQFFLNLCSVSPSLSCRLNSTWVLVPLPVLFGPHLNLTHLSRTLTWTGSLRNCTSKRDQNGWCFWAGRTFWILNQSVCSSAKCCSEPVRSRPVRLYGTANSCCLDRESENVERMKLTKSQRFSQDVQLTGNKPHPVFPFHTAVNPVFYRHLVDWSCLCSFLCGNPQLFLPQRQTDGLIYEL